MPKSSFHDIPLVYPDALGMVKCSVCLNLTMGCCDARCSYVGHMTGIALLRECTLFKNRGGAPAHEVLTV